MAHLGERESKWGILSGYNHSSVPRFLEHHFPHLLHGSLMTCHQEVWEGRKSWSYRRSKKHYQCIVLVEIVCDTQFTFWVNWWVDSGVGCVQNLKIPTLYAVPWGRWLQGSQRECLSYSIATCFDSVSEDIFLCIHTGAHPNLFPVPLSLWAI